MYNLIKTHRYKICLIAILIIAVFFRFYKITEMPPGLYPDEAMNGNNALEALSTGDFKIFYPENNGREGLFINIQAISVAVFGNFPWALRLVSVLFGIITVWGVYFLSRELFRKIQSQQVQSLKFKVQSSEIIALLSSFFLATSFWHTNFSRIGFRAIMLPFLTTFSFYFLFRGFRTKKIVNFALAGIFMGLGFHTYIAFRIVPFVVLFILILKVIDILKSHYTQNGATKNEELKNLVANIVIYGVFAILAALPLIYYFYNHPQDFVGRVGQVSVFASNNPLNELAKSAFLTLAQFNLSGDFNWRHNYAGSPLLFWPVGIFFLVGLFMSLKKCLRFCRQLFNKLPHNPVPIEYAFLIVWFAAMLAPSILTTEGLPHALRSIGAIPPVFIFAGLGAFALYNFAEEKLFKYANKKVAFVFYCLILFSVVFYGYQKYFTHYANNPNVQGAFAENYVKIGRFTNSLPQDMKKYIIASTGGTLVNGLPMPTQTTMFITDSYKRADQLEKNIFYISPGDLDKIDFHILKSYAIIPLERDDALFDQLRSLAPGEYNKGAYFDYVIKNF